MNARSAQPPFDGLDYVNLGEDSSDLIVAFDSEFRYIYVNPAVERVLGKSRDQILGHSLYEMAPHVGETSYETHYLRAMRERVLVEFEDYYAPRDRWNRVRCVPQANGGILVFARDTTDEHRAENARREALLSLVESEQRARRAGRVLDIVSDAYVTLGSDFRIRYANSAAVRLHPHAAESFLGRTYWEEWPAVIGTDAEQELRRAMAERVEARFSHFFAAPKALSGIWLDIQAYPDDEEGGLHIVYRDITAERQAQVRLQESLALLNAVINGTTDIVAAIDRNRRFLMANTAAADFLGVSTPQELSGRVDFDILSDEADHEMLRRIAQIDFAVMEAGESRNIEFSTDTTPHGGGPRAFLANKAPLRDPVGGQVIGMVNIVHDITERKIRERRDSFLADLTERTRQTLDPDALAWEAVKSTGEFLCASRCTYVEVDEDAGTLVIGRDWTSEGTPSIAGVLPLSTFGEGVLGTLRDGKRLVVADTEQDERLTAADRSAFASQGVRALVNIPIHKNGRWVGTLAVNDRIAREWDEGDVQLLAVVAERTWLAVENARLFRESRQRAEQEAFLSEASHLLNTTLDYDKTLANIARMAVPRFADWCVVDLVSEDGSRLESVAIEHVDPAKAVWGWELRRRYPTDIHAPQGIGQVLRSGKSQFFPLVTDEMIEAAAIDAEHLRILRSIGFTSAMTVPLAVRGTIFGALSLIGTGETNRLFDENDLRLAEELGRRAALAIENTRLFRQVHKAEERQRHIADTLQRSLLVTAPVDAFPALEVDTHYEAASAEAYIGGDYGDVLRVDENRIALLAGDCTGKGLDAARFVGECQFTARAFLRSNPDNPALALSLLNRMLLDGQRYDGRPDGALTCLIAAVVDSATGETLISSGGAEPALIVRAKTGRAEEVAAGGPLLGMDAEGVYSNVRVTLDRGDVLILSTDGITEARNPESREFYGYARLMKAAESIAGAQNSLQGSGQKIVADAKQFAGGRLTDDACVLIVRRAGGEPSAAASPSVG